MVAAVIQIALLLVAPPNDTGALSYDMSYEQQTESGAAQMRQKRRLAAILQVCRKAIRSDGSAQAVARYADANGLSSLGRLELAMDCQIYEQGRRDGAAPPAGRDD